MAERKVLDSWKEISVYLARSIRTCQRMERELGLPVHRLEETPKARVFAYQDEIDHWLEKSQQSEQKRFFGTSNLKKFNIPAVAVLSLTIIAVVIWNSFSSKENRTTAVPEVNTSVAIVSFENLTGDSNLDHWRRALPELLFYDLAQSRYLDVLPADKLFDVMSDLGLTERSEYSTQELEQIATNAKIENIIYGNFAKAGNIFRINASIRDFESGKDIHMESSEGQGEESFFAIIDELTAKIKQEMEFSAEQVAADIDRNVEDITTSSPEALKYYSAAWNSSFSGNVSEAIRLMEKAIEVDPQFALAYRALAALRSGSGQESQANEARQKAFELRDRVSDRERLMIESSYYFTSQQTYELGLEALQEFYALYPNSFFPNNHLGAFYWITGNWERSLEYHEKAFHISEHVVNWINLIIANEGNGYYQRAEQIYKDYRSNYSAAFRRSYRSMSEYHYLVTGDYEIALDEAQRVFLEDPDSPSLALFRADTFHLAGNLADAEGEYLRLINSVEDGFLEIEARKTLASLYLQQGRFGAAKDILKGGQERAELSDPSSQKWLMSYTSLLAYSYLMAGDIEKAHEVLDSLMDDSIRKRDPIFFRRLALWGKGRIYRELHAVDDLRRVAGELDRTKAAVMNVLGRWYILHINGLLALEEGNYSGAITHLEEVVSLLPEQNMNAVYSQHAVFFDALASAYFEAGDLKKAKATYETIGSLTIGRLYFGDLYANSFYMLGRINEQLGQRSEAIQNFEKFLELREGADPGIPEIELARESLTVLR